MKNKLIAVAVVSALSCSGAFAGVTPSKHKSEDLNTRTVLLEKRVQELQDQVVNLKNKEKKIEGNLDLGMLVEMYAHGPAIVTSPALGVRRSAEDASDLMVKLSAINEDLVLLQLRQKMDNYARENNLSIPERPIIALSGGLEGDVRHTNEYNGKKSEEINLGMAELDVIGEASPWATAAMVINYEDKVDGRPAYKNSRFKLDRGFITIGQLEKFPLYFTLGQLYAPFGSYSSYAISDSSTKAIGRTKARMVVLGGVWKGLNAQIYGYPGEIDMGTNKNIFSHTGANLGYNYSYNKFKLSVSGGVIGNLAESDGMQKEIFAAKLYPTNEKLSKRITGVDGKIKLGYDMFTLFAEYVGAVQSFDPLAITFNGSGAKPRALAVEGAMEFSLFGRPNNFAVGYGQTWEALALDLPKSNFFAEYDIAVVKNAILSFEYRHDVNYEKTDKSIVNNNTQSPVTVNGKRQNTVIAQLGIYF